MAAIKGLLFDLDGVLVDTAQYHFLAWRKMANALGFDFDEEQNEKLKGISRRESIEMILDWANITLSEDDTLRYMQQKNEWYLEYIDNMSPEEVLPGVPEFLRQCKEANYKIALGSSSKNAARILKQVQLTPLFDAIIDGTKTTTSKPDPQVFLLGAEALNLPPEQCLVFEDAIAGIDAAHNGGMLAIGIGSPDVLGHADLVKPGLKDLSISDLIDQLPT